MSLIDDTIAATGARAVSVSDTVDLPSGISRGLYVGVSGAVKVTLKGGDVVTFTALAAGVIHPMYVKRVWSTDTTATSIVAVY